MTRKQLCKKWDTPFWKDAKIDHDKKGRENPLDGTQCFGVFFGVPDIIDLLKEIEEKLI